MVALAVSPRPVFLLVRIVPLVEFHVVPMCIVFPLAVVNRLVIPTMVIVVVGVVDARVNCATADQHAEANNAPGKCRAKLFKCMVVSPGRDYDGRN